jgi:raffinose/stachyose/melibiose transport system permease protein
MSALEKTTLVTAPLRASEKARSHSLWREMLRNWRVYIMLAPNLVLFALFTAYPIVWALRYMFYDWDGLSNPTYVGLDNFVRVFTHDSMFWQSVVNTFVFASGKLLITVPLSLVLAVLLNGKLRASGLFRIIYFTPTIMGAAVMSLVFYLIFNPYNGALNQLLRAIGAVRRPIDWLGVGYAMFSVIVVAVWGAVGNYMVLFLAGLQTIPRELYEAAEIDGATKRDQFFFITLPQLGPVLQIVLLLAIINAFKGYESIMVLTGGGPAGKTQVMFLYIYQLFFPISVGDVNFQPQFGYGAAAGLVASGILGVITVVYLWSSRNMGKTE